MENLVLPRWKTLRACAIVALLTGLVFWPTLRFDYINFDDTDYVSKNLEVQKGLTLQGVAAALRERDLKLYTPLTRLSHMLDCQLYGIAPAGHHFTNVLLHTIAAILLLLVLLKCTGDLWTSTGCALFFSIHPLRSESVAWIAERKDVLSLALGLGAILAYVYYAREERRRRFHYGLCAGLMVLSLLAKPMFVTLPAILLIMDFWPLQRFSPREVKARILEKIPLAALSAATMVLILTLPGKPGDAVPAGFIKPLAWRLGNACISPMVYLGQTIWPVRLGALYVFGTECPPAWQIASCLAGLFALAGAAFLLWQSMPYLLAGWLWFLAALLPVLGIIQLGTDRHADRYTYFPGIGLALALSWSLRAALNRATGAARTGVAALSMAGLLVLCSATVAQNTIWQNSGTLWTATLENCGISETAEVNLASYLQEKGRPQEALEHAALAVKLRPYVPLAHLNLGNCLMSLHRPEEAIREYETTVRLDPSSSEGHSNLGAALLSIGKAREGIAETQLGLRLDPTQQKARQNLERALGSANASPGPA